MYIWDCQLLNLERRTSRNGRIKNPPKTKDRKKTKIKKKSAKELYPLDI